MTLGIVDLVLRLGVATLFGAVVGIERESTARGAGARTHALVALGAALFTMVGAYGFVDAAQGPADPSRVAAQVAAGVGFIGAGAIIRNGTSVLGVTTAATVWLAASIGVAAAAGGYAAALATTLLALAVLVCLRAAKPITQRFGRHRTIVELEYVRGHGTLGPLLRALDNVDGRLHRLAVEDDDETAPDGIRRVTLFVDVRQLESLENLVTEIGRRPEIRRAVLVRGEAA